MTEMNELTRSLVRVEELINGKQYQGAINLLWIAQNHALSAVKLIKDQSSAMTEQALKIKELTERVAYWQKRDETHEAEIKELDEQEPVAWRHEGFKHDSISNDVKELYSEVANRNGGDPKVKRYTIPLYARPAPAKFVPDELVQNIDELRKACEAAWSSSPTLEDCIHWTNMVGVIDRYKAKLRGE